MNLMTLPTSLNMPFDVSPYVISQMIREARNIRFHAIQVGCRFNDELNVMLFRLRHLPPAVSCRYLHRECYVIVYFYPHFIRDLSHYGSLA